MKRAAIILTPFHKSRDVHAELPVRIHSPMRSLLSPRPWEWQLFIKAQQRLTCNFIYSLFAFSSNSNQRVVIKRRNELWQPCLFLWEIIKTQSAKDGRAGNFLLFPQLLANTEHLQCQSDKQDGGGKKTLFFLLRLHQKETNLWEFFKVAFKSMEIPCSKKLFPKRLVLSLTESCLVLKCVWNFYLKGNVPI